MSDMSNGPGWWQASDSRWYPPETHPDAAHRARFASASAPDLADVGAFVTYPIRLSLRRRPELARWRPFAHLVMAVPHFVVLYALALVSSVLLFVGWLAILFTGRLPRGIHDFVAMAERYTARVALFALLLTDEYPPFDLTTSGPDPGGHAVRVDYDYETHPRNRVTVFFRVFMVIPHLIALWFLFVAAAVVYVAAWFAVVFTGRFPDPLARFLIGVSRWNARLQGYYRILTDEYPPFSMR